MLEMGIEDPFSIFDGAGVAIVFTEAKAPQHVDDELNNLGVCNILLKKNLVRNAQWQAAI